MSATQVHDQAFLSSPAPSSSATRRDTSRSRWRLRAIRAEIAEFGPAGDPALTRATEELDLLEIAAAARP